jgi:NAD(P)H dehydrogenase (quinone)
LARHQSQKRGDVVKRSDGTAIRDHVVDDDKVATVTDIGLTAGKVGSVFVSTATQHGGPETTITSFHSRLLHQGIIVGVPYAFPGLTNMNEITGGSPYGASTLAKGDGSRQPSANELDGARYQGKHVAQITAKLTHNQ